MVIGNSMVILKEVKPVTVEKMTLQVPMLPPLTAGGNSRAHWAEKYADSEVFGTAVFYVCRSAINLIQRQRAWVPFDRVKLKITLVFRKERERDDDNLRIRFKSGQDSLVKAQLVLKDDSKHFKVTEIVPVVDPTRSPLTIIEVEGERDV